MADTNDTTDGLLAEFRGYAAGMPPSYHVTMSWHDFRVMLDRLEAAHKRERGDVAKLREALKHIKDRLPHMLQYMRVHWEDASAGGYFDELMLVINAALSTPPRNCDVGDAADWEKRFGEECDKGHICSDCPVRYAKTRMAIELDKGARCEFVWMQMPYEGGAK